MNNYNIILDPGHGGSDPGAVGKYLVDDYQMQVEVLEKDVNLAVALYTRRYLMDNYPDNFNVRMTRNNDKYLTLQERCIRAKDVKADLFISIHCNSFDDSSVTGFETFYYYQDAIKFANMLQKNMEDDFVNNANRGIKSERYYVIKNSIPNAVLFECEFLSNPEKAEWLTEENTQRQFGLVIGETVREFFLC